LGQEKMLLMEKLQKKEPFMGMLQKKVLLIEMLQEGIFQGAAS
jgi:hypothetical protein